MIEIKPLELNKLPSAIQPFPQKPNPFGDVNPLLPPQEATNGSC
jgi:hypothetical protein